MSWEEKTGKLWQSYGRHVLVIFVVVLLVHDVFGAHGFIAMRQKQQEIKKVSGVLDRLNKENALLEQDVEDLKSDPQTIQRIARDELGLAKPQEIIIKLPVAEPPTPESAFYIAFSRSTDQASQEKSHTSQK
jgi:cell division protein FtsB